MQHAQATVREVLQRVGHRAQLAPLRTAERDGDRVDGEVAAKQVLLRRARAHLGQGARRGVGLGAAAGDVDAPAGPGDERRAEALVRSCGDRLATAARRSSAAKRSEREAAPRRRRHRARAGPGPAAGRARRRRSARRPPVGGQLEQLRAAGQLMQALEHRPAVDPPVAHARPRHALSVAPPSTDPDGDAGRRQVRLGLGDRVAAVVEDRRAQHRVGAGAQRLGEVLELARRRPRRSRARSTASLTAAVSARS